MISYFWNVYKDVKDGSGGSLLAVWRRCSRPWFKELWFPWRSKL
jgi:hypothetical protein